MTSLSLSYIKRKTLEISRNDIGDLRVVIAFSLYEKANLYIDGLIKNCEIIENVYPSFWKYIFVGNDFDHSLLNKLSTFTNIKFIYTGLSGHINASMRFIAIDYPEVGVAFSRDCDSFVNRRDIYCINGFLQSNKRFQIIRDSPSHNTYILAGMWGIKKGCIEFKIYDKIIELYKNIEPIYGTDQEFLSMIIYPRIRNDALVYDEFFNFPGEIPQNIHTGFDWTSYTHVGACVSYEKATE